MLRRGRESRFRAFLPAGPRRACSRCGYDITGSHVPGRCPECGRWNAPYVGNPGPRQFGAYAAACGILGLIVTHSVVLSMFFGLAAVGLATRAIVGPSRRHASDDERMEALAGLTLGVVLLLIQGAKLVTAWARG